MQVTRFALVYIRSTAVVYILLAVHVEGFTVGNLNLSMYVAIVNAYLKGCDCSVDVFNFCRPNSNTHD